MALLVQASRVSYLRALGFRGSFTTMVRNFQRGYTFSNLAIDGLYGPATDAALRNANARRLQGKGTASQNFSFHEFRCKCYGRYAACQGVVMHRTHIKRLQMLRDKIGRSVPIVSGYRCPNHNRAVGGASSSQHMFGVACDIPGIVSVSGMKSLGIFAGVGYSLSTGKVLHVDSRDIGGHNTTGGRTSAPTVWRYA